MQPFTFYWLEFLVSWELFREEWGIQIALILFIFAIILMDGVLRLIVG